MEDAGGAFDVLIAGAGPAGLNAALVLGRAKRRVALCDSGDPRNFAATEMHGFLTRDGYSPRAIELAAHEELRRYGSVEIFEDEVVRLVRDDLFVGVMRSGRELRARRVLLATGMRDDLPNIRGLEDRWGRSVFVCPHCDGWEVRDRRIGVFGAPVDVVGLAQELRRWSADLVLFGVQPGALDAGLREWVERTAVTTVSGTPVSLEGEDRTLRAIACDDGMRVPVDVLFLCVPLRQRSPLVAAIGCELDVAGAVRVDVDHRTSVGGVYACGDMVTRVHQVIVAAASGVKAAIALDEDLLDEDLRRAADLASTKARTAG